MTDDEARRDRVVEPSAETTPPPIGERPYEQRRPPGNNRLLRSRTDRVVSGVAGGIGHYFGVDPTLIRLAFVLLVVAGGSGVLLYVILWIVVPEADEGAEFQTGVPPFSAEKGRLILGAILVTLGIFVLLRRVIPWFDAQVIWALLLIAFGAAVLLKGIRR